MGLIFIGLAVLIEIAAFLTWLYIVVDAFRHQEEIGMWVGFVCLLVPPFIIYYALVYALVEYSGKKRIATLGLTVTSHAFTTPLLIYGGLLLDNSS